VWAAAVIHIRRIYIHVTGKSRNRTKSESLDPESEGLKFRQFRKHRSVIRQPHVRSRRVWKECKPRIKNVIFTRCRKQTI